MNKLLNTEFNVNIDSFIPYLLTKGLSSLILLVIGLLVIKIILKLEVRILDKKNIDKSLYKFIINSSKILLLIFLLIWILQNFGVSTTSILTVLGSMGIAIALALKDSLGNIAGGIILIITHPFRHKDHIELKNVNGTEGIVESIDLLTTQIHTFDNQILTIPNGMVTTSVITNHSRTPQRRLVLEFGVGYDANLEDVKKILIDIAMSNDKIFKNPEPTVGVSSQGASAIYLELKVWTRYEDLIDVRYYLQEKSKLEFDKAGINIPYPQMDLHMKTRS